MDVTFYDIWLASKSLLAVQFVATIILASIMYRNPRIVFKVLQRWWMFKAGFKVKRVKTDKDFTFEYMEKGSMSKCTSSLLLVHGFTATKDSFCGLGKYLPKRFHVIAVDLPGHGGTTRKDDDDMRIEIFVERLKQFVDATGLSNRKFHLAGTSFGGFVSGMYSIKHHHDLSSLILVAPSCIKEGQMPILETIFKETGKVLLLPETDSEFKSMFTYLVYKDMHLPDFIVSGIMQIRMEGYNFYSRLITEMERTNERSTLGDRLDEIKNQTLVVWGKQDKILDVSSIDVFKQKLPSCDIEVLDECGHSIPLERPRKLASVITKFLNNIEDPAQ